MSVAVGGLRLGISTLLVCFLTACSTFRPGLEAKTPFVHGVVLDAASGEPIKGAKVQFVGLTSPTAYSDQQGEFVLKNLQRFTLQSSKFVCGSCYGEWLSSFSLRVDHSHSERLEASLGAAVSGKDSAVVRRVKNGAFYYEVRLKPSPGQ